MASKLLKQQKQIFFVNKDFFSVYVQISHDYDP